MDQNNYEFIMNQTSQKKPLFGGSKKQRITIIVAGAALALLLGILLVTVISASSKNTQEVLAPVGGAQADIIAITEIGAKEARDTATINKTASVSLTVSSQNAAIMGQLGKNAKKIIAPYQNSGYEAVLDDAKNSGSFDKTYQTILTERLDLYRQTLVTAYSQTKSAKLKKELESYYAQIGVILGEPTTPKQ